MIHPSYVDLMKVVNKNVEEGETPVINSRYSIVMATAKRARQIVDGDEPLVKVSRGEKPLSIAIDELNQEEIRILAEDEIEEEYIDPSAEYITEENADEEAGQEEAPEDSDTEAAAGAVAKGQEEAVEEESAEGAPQESSYGEDADKEALDGEAEEAEASLTEASE